MKAEESEVVSAKVQSDMMELEELKAEVARLKKVDETNGRLKKYNGELRHALIKAQVQSPSNEQGGLPIPEDAGHEELFSNESVEVCPNRSSDAVFLNSLVMEGIFKKLHVKDLRNCRLICKKWNQDACSLLFKRKNCYLFLRVDPRLENPEEMVAFIDDNLQKIQDLHSVVAAAPEAWCRKVILDRSFLRLPEIQSILNDFGSRLRSIIVTTGSTCRIQDFQRILVDLCPNLETLAIKFENEEDLSQSQQLLFPHPLKLTFVHMRSTLCIGIVKASPNLKILSCRGDINDLAFFKDLQTYPEITRNLEEVELYCDIFRTEHYDMIKGLNSVQFSQKLKSLSLLNFSWEQFASVEMSEIFEKVGGSMQKLIMHTFNWIETPQRLLLTFPTMNKLTEFRFLSNWDALTSIDFLTDMPSLQVLHLGHGISYPPRFENYQDDLIDNLFLIPNCEKLRRTPQVNLRELYLYGILKQPPRTIEMLNQIFPNLTKLVVGLFVARKRGNDGEVRDYYTSAFQGLSEIRNLRNLYLDFRKCKGSETQIFDINCFCGNLILWPNLEHLTIRGVELVVTSLDWDHYLSRGFPNLRLVTLKGTSMDLNYLKAAKIFAELLYRNDIPLEILDAKVEEDFRVHHNKF